MTYIRCRDCPYGEEDFTFRMALYSMCQETDKNCSILKKYPTADEYAYETEQFVRCDKVGGKVYNCGHCTDWNEDDQSVNIRNHAKRKRKNKRERDQLHKQHLKWLAENSQDYPCPVTYEDKIWVRGYGYVENPKSYYKRWYRGRHKDNRYKYYKKYANRAVRRYNDEIHNGCCYKKIFDYWWAVD